MVHKSLNNQKPGLKRKKGKDKGRGGAGGVNLGWKICPQHHHVAIEEFAGWDWMMQNPGR